MADLSKWYIPLTPRAPTPTEFEQGDIFRNATIPTVADIDLSQTQEIPTRKGSLVVLTQSCDVPKSPALLMAEMYTYKSLLRSQADLFKSSKTKDGLVRNRMESWFLLPPPDDDAQNWHLVSFRHLHVVSPRVLAALADEQMPIRLASPYKEYLGESFARFMMRVALPEPLDEFKAISWT